MNSNTEQPSVGGVIDKVYETPLSKTNAVNPASKWYWTVATGVVIAATAIGVYQLVLKPTPVDEDDKGIVVERFPPYDEQLNSFGYAASAAETESAAPAQNDTTAP